MGNSDKYAIRRDDGLYYLTTKGETVSWKVSCKNANMYIGSPHYEAMAEVRGLHKEHDVHSFQLVDVSTLEVVYDSNKVLWPTDHQGEPLSEVVIYLDNDYGQNKSLWVNPNLTLEEITKMVNKENNYYGFDVLDPKEEG